MHSITTVFAGCASSVSEISPQCQNSDVQGVAASFELILAQCPHSTAPRCTVRLNSLTMRVNNYNKVNRCFCSKLLSHSLFQLYIFILRIYTKLLSEKNYFNCLFLYCVTGRQPKYYIQVPTFILSNLCRFTPLS